MDNHDNGNGNGSGGGSVGGSGSGIRDEDSSIEISSEEGPGHVAAALAKAAAAKISRRMKQPVGKNGHQSQAKRWNDGEREAYHRAFAKYGMRWDRLARAIPDRSAENLRHYYHRVFKKKHPEMVDGMSASTEMRKIRKRNPNWTTEEEELFHKAFTQYGTQVSPLEDCCNLTHCSQYSSHVWTSIRRRSNSGRSSA